MISFYNYKRKFSHICITSFFGSNLSRFCSISSIVYKFVKSGDTLKKKGWRTTVKVADQNGKALSAKEAVYTIAELPANHTLTAEQVTKLMGYTASPEQLDVELPMGTVINVAVTLNQKEYIGTATGTYRILAKGNDLISKKFII